MLETIDSRKEKMIKDMIEYHDKQLKECEEVIIMGVRDYHGENEAWLVP
jgi:hypothetical protein